MAPVTSPAKHAGSTATSRSNRERRQSKVHRAMEWPKPSSVRSNVTMSASVRARMHRPSCTSSQLGLITTTRFTPTRLSDIVHPVSSSQLTEARDRCPVVRGLQQNPMSGAESLGEFKGRLVSLVMYYHARNVLAALTYANKPRRIVEIGGGYGEIARMWLKNPIAPPEFYVIVDI